MEILWLMPIHPIGSVKRKGTLGSYYSIQDHKGINPEFGTAADLTALVTTVHALGMKIIIDWVANHAAWDHVWTETNPGFFTRDAAGNFTPPYDWDDVIQIDHTDPHQQEAMKDAMKFWINIFDIDGFRADLAHLTPLQFWKDARTELTPLKKDLVWLAETEETSYHEAFDISFTWEWMHATEKFARKQASLADCVNVLKKYTNDFPQNAMRLFFTSNHDENSWNGTEYEKFGDLTKTLAVFSCLYTGIPLVYSGQELPNTKRLKFFEKDRIDWNKDIGLQEFYRKLFSLRKTNSAYLKGTVSISESSIEKNILAFTVSRDADIVAVFLNMSDAATAETIPLENVSGSFRDIFSGEMITINGEYRFAVETGGIKVFERY